MHYLQRSRKPENYGRFRGQGQMSVKFPDFVEPYFRYFARYDSPNLAISLILNALSASFANI